MIKSELLAWLQTINFRVAIITLSDRASRGEYEDVSGKLLSETLVDFFRQHELRLETAYSLLPDESNTFRDCVKSYLQQGYHFVFTTGSTGIGPRDIAPDVIKSMLDKEIPGIMELIRVKYGTINPNAAISRSLAGVAGQTLLYALPGSPKAVKEYMDEILKSLYIAL